MRRNGPATWASSPSPRSLSIPATRRPDTTSFFDSTSARCPTHAVSPSPPIDRTRLLPPPHAAARSTVRRRGGPALRLGAAGAVTHIFPVILGRQAGGTTARRAGGDPGGELSPRRDLFFLFFLCFAGLMLGHRGKTTRRTTRRQVDTSVRGGNGSCQWKRKLLRSGFSVEKHVRGGNSRGFSEELLRGSFRARRRVPVRGRRKSCKRVYTEKLLGDGKTTATSEVPTREHRLSDLKT
jgi:hypothetical protein